LSTYRLLPPSHQIYWYCIHSYIRHQKTINVVCIYRAELEVIRKATSAKDQLYNYTADPFVVSEAKFKAAQEKEKLEREDSEREKRLLKALEASWLSLPAVIMSSETRNIAVGLSEYISILKFRRLNPFYCEYLFI
jgi:hypothetical protein